MTMLEYDTACMAFAALKLRLFIAVTILPTLSRTSGATAFPVTLSPRRLQAVVTIASCFRSAALEVAKGTKNNHFSRKFHIRHLPAQRRFDEAQGQSHN